jgi:hypothetical protein
MIISRNSLELWTVLERWAPGWLLSHHLRRRFMSRVAKFFVISWIVGIFLFSFAFDLLSVREVAPGREVRWVKIRILHEDSRHAQVSLGLPVGLVEMLLNSSRHCDRVDVGGRDMDLREIWRRLLDTRSGSPLELGDDGNQVQIWLE